MCLQQDVLMPCCCRGARSGLVGEGGTMSGSPSRTISPRAIYACLLSLVWVREAGGFLSASQTPGHQRYRYHHHSVYMPGVDRSSVPHQWCSIPVISPPHISRRLSTKAPAAGGGAELVDAAAALGASVDESLRAGTFVRATLTQPRQESQEDCPDRIQARVVQLSKGLKLQLLLRYARRDETKNHDVAEAGHVLASHMRKGFLSGRLFTTGADMIFEEGQRTKRVKATFKEVPALSHDKAKKRRLTMPAAEEGDVMGEAKPLFLQELGVVGPTGQPKSGMADKLRQIERFVEILDHLMEASDLPSKQQDGRRLRMLDGGAGKGYLTFAAYQHLRSKGYDLETVGIDIRKDLCDKGNQLAGKLGFESLKFVQGTIDDVASGELGREGASVVVALHACDTATDDALFHGVRLGAEIIICAPCCHKEVRRQIERSMGRQQGLTGALQGVLKHGILLERQAEIATDAIRALALETAGYKAQVLEFISNDHTRKNLMITAVKRTGSSSSGSTSQHRERLSELLRLYGVREQRLLALMGLRIDQESFAIQAEPPPS